MPAPKEWHAHRRAFAAELDWARLHSGFRSIRELARRAFVSHTLVARALNGSEWPSETTVRAIVTVLGADVESWLARWRTINEMPVESERVNGGADAAKMTSPWDAVPVIDGADPDEAGCSPDALTVQARRIAMRHERKVLGYVELRYSPSKDAAWCRFGGFGTLKAIAAARGDVEVDVSVQRASDKREANFSLAYAYEVHWSGLVVPNGSACSARAQIRFGDTLVASNETGWVRLPPPVGR